ncbi:MAG: hypothetical protein JST87_05425 [Bacteroidetes bacterium]|nr:hypothetical protein [Bacteroidota bacterium]
MQLSILDAIQARDAGIKKSSDHAEQVNPGWNERCYRLLQWWLSTKSKGFRFKTEDFRIASNLEDMIEKPAHDRAFGGIIVRAFKAGLIRKIGTIQVVNPKAHCANATLWEVI